MGLDITYISKVVKSSYNQDALDDVDGFSTNCNNNFDYQLGSLKKFSIYGLSSESEQGYFRAGSYSGYNHWRNELAIMAGYDGAQGVWNDFNNNLRYLKLKKLSGELAQLKPFYELIHFSDCDGLIGPEICKKLYQDFVNFEDKAKKEDENFYELYLMWKEAFRVASDGGLVCFH